MIERTQLTLHVRNPYANCRAGYYPEPDPYTITSRQRLVIFITWAFAIVYIIFSLHENGYF